MFPCRVPGCGRMLRSAIGESRHFSALHCRDLPLVNPSTVPVNTRCIEIDDDRPLSHGQDDDDPKLGDQDAHTSHPSGPSDGPVGEVGTVQALPSDVFLELARTLTRGRRRGRSRQGQPSTQARRARQADGRHRGQPRRRHRRALKRTVGAGCTGPEDGGAIDASGEPSCIPASGGKATGVESSTIGAGRWSASDSGSDKDDGDHDRRLCDDVFARYERFGEADQSTLAFPLSGGGRACGGNPPDRGDTSPTA